MLDKLIRGCFVLLAVIAGGSRATIHHPAVDKKYRQWLITSPWQARMPLPLGPITLAWQDVLFLGVLTAAAWLLAPAFVLWPAIVFLVAFVLFTLAILADTKQHAAVILIGYCLAALIQFLDFPQFLLLGLVAFYAIEDIALRRSLWEFPWISDSRKPATTKVGWPFEQLATRESKSSVSPLVRNLIVATMVGAWVFSISRICYVGDPRHGLQDWAALAGMFVLFIAFGRLIAYTSNYPSPISFWGRIATGNWIIPKYDRVFLGPLWVLLGGAILILVMWLSDIYEPAQVAICFAVPLWIAMSIGPSLPDWKLTGAHRIRANAVETKSRAGRRQSLRFGNTAEA